MKSLFFSALVTMSASVTMSSLAQASSIVVDLGTEYASQAVPKIEAMLFENPFVGGDGTLRDFVEANGGIGLQHRVPNILNRSSCVLRLNVAKASSAHRIYEVKKTYEVACSFVNDENNAALTQVIQLANSADIKAYRAEDSQGKIANIYFQKMALKSYKLIYKKFWHEPFMNKWEPLED